MNRLSINYLTQPAIETQYGELSREPVTDKRYLFTKAMAVRETLADELGQQSKHIPPAGSRRWDDLRAHLSQVAKTGDVSRLKVFGFWIEAQQLTHLAQTLLRNRPLEIQAVNTTSLDPYEKGPDHSFANQLHGIAMTSVLRRLGLSEYMRPVMELDDANYKDTSIAVDGLHRQALLRRLHGVLLDAKVVHPDDSPGKDFLYLPYSTHATKVDSLIDELDNSEAGIVADYKDGRVFFRPNQRVHQTALWMQPYTKQPPADGVLLKDAEGHPSKTAIQAASYLHPINTAFTHVSMQSYPFKGYNLSSTNYSKLPSDFLELDILLQALDRASPHSRYNIVYDRGYVSPQHTAYILTHLLHSEMGRIAKTLQATSDVSRTMKPQAYFDHNYSSPEGIWPIDVQGVRAIASELPLHFYPESIKSATVIGYGPFSYPALAAAPFMKKDSTMVISDLLPANIALVTQWFTGSADEKHNQAYRQFAQLFKSGKKTGQFYNDCEQQLRAVGRPIVAALEQLPSDSAQLVIESFVSCSYNSERHGFFEAIKQKARILKWGPDSMMISVHMVGSKGWNNSGDNEGVTMEAADLSLEDIQAAYASAGLRVVKITPLYADSSFREGHKGMVVIFAKPDTVVKPQSIPR